MLTGICEVEAQYIGFDAKRLPSVLREFIRDLRKDHPGIDRVRIPLLQSAHPGIFGRAKGVGGDASFLAGIACDDCKIIGFDGGEDDAEANGFAPL